MSSSHCIFLQLHLPCCVSFYTLKDLINHPFVSLDAINTLASSCSSSPVAAATTAEQTSLQGGHPQGSICTEVATAGVMSCSKSLPFVSCLLMQRAHLGLSVSNAKLTVLLICTPRWQHSLVSFLSVPDKSGAQSAFTQPCARFPTRQESSCTVCEFPATVPSFLSAESDEHFCFPCWILMS